MYQLIGYAIILFNIGFYFFIASIKDGYTVTKVSAAFMCLLLLFCFDYMKFRKQKNFISLTIILLAAALPWFIEKMYLPFSVNVLLAALYAIATRSLIIIVDKQGVSYPSFPVKKYAWAQLQNVMLKDDILTIDCKNNKIYQPEIQNAEQFANEAEFNDFCSKHLAT